MSARLARLLLKLYPKRVRERYGDELIDLHEELRKYKSLSRARLIGDMVTGAILARPRHQIGRAAVALVVICGATVSAVLLSSTESSRPALRAVAEVPQPGGGVYHPPAAGIPVPRKTRPIPSPATPSSSRAGNGVFYPPAAPVPVPRKSRPAIRSATQSSTRGGNGIYYPPVKPNRSTLVTPSLAALGRHTS